MPGSSLPMNELKPCSASRYVLLTSLVQRPLFTIRTGKSNRCREQAFQDGAVHISPIPNFFVPYIHISRMVEALTDPKTWLFALFSALDNVPNSLTNQQSLIVASFGFTALQTTLLSCIPGVVEIVTIFTGVRLAARRPNSRAYVGAAYFVPSWLGILLVNLLPWSDKVCGCFREPIY
jgi:hypothetical protein